MPICKICNKEYKESPFFPSLMICSHECHTVDFWNRALDDKAIIIDGVCYHDGGNKPKEKSSFLGHSGRIFKIKFKDGSLLVTNNLWYNGDVPKERNVIDNAEFVEVLRYDDQWQVAF